MNVGRCRISRYRQVMPTRRKRAPVSLFLLPSPSVTFTQADTYNISANVPVLAVSIPHALRVTLRPFSHWAQVVSNILKSTRKGNGNASPLESRCKITPFICNIGKKNKKVIKNKYFREIPLRIPNIFIRRCARSDCMDKGGKL